MARPRASLQQTKRPPGLQPHPLRARLDAIGMTGRELAGLSGCSEALVSLILARLREPGPALKVRITRVLGVRADLLFPPN